jgi:hypothetical protein
MLVDSGLYGVFQDVDIISDFKGITLTNTLKA